MAALGARASRAPISTIATVLLLKLDRGISQGRRAGRPRSQDYRFAGTAANFRNSGEEMYKLQSPALQRMSNG